MDFTSIKDHELIDLAENAVGVYDGLRIYGDGRNAEGIGDLILSANHVWSNIKAEIERRGLGREIGL